MTKLRCGGEGVGEWPFTASTETASCAGYKFQEQSKDGPRFCNLHGIEREEVMARNSHSAGEVTPFYSAYLPRSRG